MRQIILMFIAFALSSPMTLSAGPSKTIALPSGKMGEHYQVDLNRFFKMGSDPIHYEGLLMPYWLEVSSDGLLQGTPGVADVGQQTLTVEATSSGVLERVNFVFRVEHVNYPPKWNNPEEDLGVVCAGTKTVFDIRGLVSDANGDPLRFRSLDLPSWGRMENTRIGFMPMNNIKGRFEFMVYAIDPHGAKAEVKMHFQVADCH